MSYGIAASLSIQDVGRIILREKCPEIVEYGSCKCGRKLGQHTHACLTTYLKTRDPWCGCEHCHIQTDAMSSQDLPKGSYVVYEFRNANDGRKYTCLVDRVENGWVIDVHVGTWASTSFRPQDVIVWELHTPRGQHK